MTTKRTLRWSVAIACCAVLVVAIAFANAQSAAARQQTNSLRSSRAAETKQALEAGEIDVNTSRAYVYVGKTGLGHEHAVEGRVKEGKIRLGETKDAGSIVFDMATFTADTDQARRYIGLRGRTDAATQQQVNANMLGSAVLDVRRFPTATFKIASALPLKTADENGNPQYQLSGEFTLHGVTHPMKLNVQTEPGKDRVRLRGGFSILQTSFGITPYSKAFGVVGVANQLTIYGEIDVAK